MSSRKHGRNAFESGLNGAITAGANAIDLDSTSGLTAPGYLCLEPESPTMREYISFTGINVNQLTGVSRGLAGSAGGAQAHGSGVKARMIFVHQLLEDLWNDIEASETAIANLETADTDHFGGTDTDDHPEATTGVRGFMSSADKIKLDALDPTDQVTGGDSHDHAGGDGAQIDHGGLAGLGDDDHGQYLTLARHFADASVMRITKSIPQSIVEDTATTITNYQTTTQDVDPGGYLSANLSTGVITMGPGVYFVSGLVTWESNLPAITGADVTNGWFRMSVAGASVSVPGHFNSDAGTGAWQSASNMLFLPAGGSVSIEVHQLSTGLTLDVEFAALTVVRVA